MFSENPKLPSNREMLVRIQKNLRRTQGFVEVLNDEVDNPSKNGPGTVRDDWKRDARALQDQLRQLEELLAEIELKDPHA